VYSQHIDMMKGVGGGRSITMGGRSPGCFFRVSTKRSISKPDQHGKDIIYQESL